MQENFEPSNNRLQRPDLGSIVADRFRETFNLEWEFFSQLEVLKDVWPVLLQGLRDAPQTFIEWFAWIGSWFTPPEDDDC